MTTVNAWHTPKFEVGDLLYGRELSITHERALWYGDGLMTSAAGERRLAASNIHTDDDYARSQGLSTAIADGMHSTNWISSMLLRDFGRDYIERGELRTKYINPTMVGATLKVLGRVRSKTQLDHGGSRYELEVWTEDLEGLRLTVGEAIIEVLASA